MTETQLEKIGRRIESSRHNMTQERVTGLALASLLEDYAVAQGGKGEEA